MWTFADSHPYVALAMFGVAAYTLVKLVRVFKPAAPKEKKPFKVELSN